MKEFELSAPIEKWLKTQGMKVYVEVPVYSYSAIDMVGKVGNKIIAVELKLSLSKKVIHQAWLNTSFVNFSWCAVPTKPKQKGIDICKKRGLGILQVLKNGDVIIIIDAVCKNPPFEPHKSSVTRYLEDADEGGVGGHPNRKGVGPAQDVKRQIDAIRLLEPNITWQELFDRIPNHYSNYRSMQTSMHILEDRLAARERRSR